MECREGNLTNFREQHDVVEALGHFLIEGRGEEASRLGAWQGTESATPSGGVGSMEAGGEASGGCARDRTTNMACVVHFSGSVTKST